MNLKQLEAFVWVAREGSFSGAARELYLTQPTVSAHIAALEKKLGICLLKRTTKEVSLTAEGEELYVYAEQMLALEGKIRERFGKKPRTQQKPLCIAASTVPSQYLLPRIMTRFRQEYPGAQMKVLETDSAGVVGKILSRRADIGFTGTVLEKGNCVYLPFYQDELVVIAPVSDVFRKRQGKSLTEWIRKEPVILREEGSGTRKEAGRILKESGISMEELNVAASMENQETIKRSVENGMGISILSRLAAEEEIRSGRLLAFPLEEGGGRRNINIVYDRDIPLPPAAEKFIRTVKELYPAAEKKLKDL